MLVISKAHIPDLFHLPDELGTSLAEALRVSATAVKNAFGAEGIHVRQNNGASSGQDVFHIHFHVIPRFLGDEFEKKEYEAVSLDVRKLQAAELRRRIGRC